MAGRLCSSKSKGRADIDYLSGKLRGVAGDLERVLVRLEVEGALSLEDRQYFEEQIVDGVSAAFCFMRVDDRGLIHIVDRNVGYDILEYVG